MCFLAEYSFHRRVLIVLATVLAPLSYFGAACHLSSETVDTYANVTVNYNVIRAPPPTDSSNVTGSAQVLTVKGWGGTK